ncbi:MAG: transposase [Victivallales bacterium]
MGRISRTKAGRGVYHVYNRALNSAWILSASQERDKFLQILAGHLKKYPLMIHHYCIMSDHFHLVIAGEMQDISAFVGGCSSVYSKFWHYGHAGSGPVWQGRFRSILVQKELYLNRLGRYVEQNPLRAGMGNLSKAEDYKWSSAAAYVSGMPDLLIDPKNHPYRRNWGETNDECRKNYAEYLRMAEPDDTSFFEGMEICIGDGKFKASVASLNGRIQIRRGRPSRNNININDL